jgi:hypothetical protein
VTLISAFHRDGDKICALLGYYAASSGNCLPTFRDNVSETVRLLTDIPEERKSCPLVFSTAQLASPHVWLGNLFSKVGAPHNSHVKTSLSALLYMRSLHRSTSRKENVSLMKQQFAVTHRHTVYGRQKKPDLSWIDQRLSTLCFLQKYKEKQFFCGNNILTGVFVTQLSSDAGISVWRIVWIMTSCCFTSDMHRIILINPLKTKPICFI